MLLLLWSEPEVSAPEKITEMQRRTVKQTDARLTMTAQKFQFLATTMIEKQTCRVVDQEMSNNTEKLFMRNRKKVNHS